ncbi:MAG TPA: hypothetical protein DCS43_00290, partial [Verrucomicrobia bacterium]|nr:hypothetical protein [Verrucomicrobiota bacterium]
MTFVFMAGSSVFAAGPDIHQLGPTGLAGTLEGKTINVMSVAKGSPAEGKISKGDQIIGAGSVAFATDPRRELAVAIDSAETEAGGGTLTLSLAGDKTVALQLAVLGSYSDTAPWNCPKSQAI